MTTAYDPAVRRWVRCLCGCRGLVRVTVHPDATRVDVLCPTTDAWESGTVEHGRFRCACGAVAEVDLGGEPVCGHCYAHPEARMEAEAAQ